MTIQLKFDAMETIPGEEKQGSLFDDKEIPPAGTYKVIISNVEKRQTKAGDDTLCVTYEIIEGEHKSFQIYDYLNIWHSSEKPRNIAKIRLKNLIQACDKLNKLYVENAEELINNKVKVKVKHREYNGKHYLNITSIMPVDYKNESIKIDNKADTQEEDYSDIPF